jgi:hypothetical protein
MLPIGQAMFLAVKAAKDKDTQLEQNTFRDLQLLKVIQQGCHTVELPS